MSRIMNNPVAPSSGVGENQNHAKLSLAQAKQTSTTQVLQRGKLQDITNQPVKEEKKVKKAKVSLKRPEEEVVNDGKKRRKSDPMQIDEEIQMGGNPVVWDDIDATDIDDPQAVVEYVNDIYDFMAEKEQKSRISSNYMSNQVDINEKMRAILIDWLVSVHLMFKLLPETLYLSVYIIDQYLQIQSIARDKLQLVGITSMLIASKYEEIYPPECNDFVYISDGAYTKKQILSMEQQILNTLNFNLTSPSALHFLRRFSKAAGSDYTVHTLCKYIIELMLIDARLLKFLPSQIAAGSVYIARVMMSKTPLWTPTLEHFTKFKEADVKVVAIEMNELLKRAQKSQLKAIRKKYLSSKYSQVASFPVAEIV